MMIAHTLVYLCLQALFIVDSQLMRHTDSAAQPIIYPQGTLQFS